MPESNFILESKISWLETTEQIKILRTNKIIW